MPTLRGRLLVDGKLLTGTLGWERGRITRVDTVGEIGGADLPVIAPGLVDLHVHGHGGFDPVEDVRGMAESLARAGTTAFQPTLFPEAPERLGATCERVWKRVDELPQGAFARVVGLHLEGPFVNRLAAGALPVHDLAEPSVAGLRAILGPATGAGRGVRTMTLAPELTGAAELVGELARSGVRVSLGHSRATAEEARRAARSGACGATHLFNAMPPVHHREVGLAGFALTDAALFAEIIGDLVHVGPEMFELALRARGPDGLCLVSDALRGAGTGCERFHSHGRDHLLRGGAAYYPSKEAGGAPQLAGSAMSQLEMVRLLVSRGVVGLIEALTMATATPARALGLEKELGALRIGLAADFLVLRGKELTLEAVYVAGERAGGGARH
ncbi:MAG: amidohydrolase family protein [Planctomycetes bacterium]|nr:amidohydrolase family protein [Planctomycetota bacterium]